MAAVIVFMLSFKKLIQRYIFPLQFILSRTTRMILLKCHANRITSVFKALLRVLVILNEGVCVLILSFMALPVLACSLSVSNHSLPN